MNYTHSFYLSAFITCCSPIILDFSLGKVRKFFSQGVTFLKQRHLRSGRRTSKKRFTIMERCAMKKQNNILANSVVTQP